MSSRPRIVTFVHVVVSLFFGTLYGLALAFVGYQALTFYESAEYANTFLGPLLILGTILGAIYIYRRDLPRISPSNMVGLLVTLFAMIGMLVGATLSVPNQYRLMATVCAMLGGIALAVGVGMPYRSARHRLAADP